MTTRLWRLLPALLLLFPTTAARADEPLPDAAAIRQHIREAAGPEPTVLRQTTVTMWSNNSSEVTRTRVQRGEDYREAVDEGPFHTERGSVNGEAWRENENGQVVTVQPEQPSPSASQGKQKETVSRVHAPVDAYLIETRDPSGAGVKEYVDPATWQVVRRDVTVMTVTVVATYDDFRNDHGRTFAHHWRLQLPISRTTSDSRITLYETGNVQDRDVARPVVGRPLIEFPAGIHLQELPVTFAPSGHVYVRVTIGNRGLDFLLDTGADGIFMDTQVARELGLVAKRGEQDRAMVSELRVADLRMRNVAVNLLNQGWLEPTGAKIVGVLGFDFLSELGVTLDYERKRVTVVPGVDYRPPADPHTTQLAVRLGTGQPMTTVTINGVSADRFILDTGGVGTFFIHDYFARRHPEALHDEGGGKTAGHHEFYGATGPFDTRAYQIKSLWLANINFVDFLGYRVTSSGSYGGPTDGVIGPDFLHIFTLGLDYRNSRVYLTPNAEGRNGMGIK